MTKIERQSSEATVLASTANGLPVLAYDVLNRVGESPAWSNSESALYWIDVRGQELLRLHPESLRLDRWALPDVVGAMVLCESGSVWLAMRHSLASLDPRTGVCADIAQLDNEPRTNRLNDGKVSPTGKWLVFGSMDDRPVKEPTGSLYVSDGAGAIRRLHSGLVVCNGIAFNPEGSRIYFSDSARGLVMRADWDEASGVMGAPTLFCTLKESMGRPDGATVDDLGNYWSAGVSAGRLNQVNAAGQLMRTIDLPCRAPTMPTFGGVDGRTMFVTSLVRPEWTSLGPFEGALLAIPSPSNGSPSVRLLA
jgi:sugar lactone lactonase YvrE